MVRGLQAAGVAATVKHAPGMGHISSDTHHGLAVASAERSVLDAREFVPFRAAFAAGARLAMSGHMALPAVTGRDDLPGTLSRAVMTDLLRRDLGFEGVTISDALDMRALAQGPAQVLDVLAAVRAGVDLLLASADPEALARIEETLVRAVARELLDPAEVAATERRVAALRAWLGSAGPAPDLVGRRERRAPGPRRRAGRALDHARPRPGRAPAAATGESGPILAVMPRPADLTPADTSSTVAPGLAAALRRQLRDVDEIVVEQAPDAASIAAVRDRAAAARAVVIGTIDGHRQPAQIELVEALAAHGHTGRRRRAARPVGRRGVPGWRHGPRHLLDPARLARGPRGRPRRRGRGARPPPGRRPVCHHRLMSLRDEILEQPEVAARFLRRAPEVVGPLADAIRARGVDHVVIAARGTSDHAAIYAQYVLGVRHALSVGLERAVGDLAVRRASRGSIGRSSSASASPAPRRTWSRSSRPGAGRAPRRWPSRTTRTRRWPTAAETTIDLGAGPELAIAATKTYTTELLAVAALSAALSRDPADATALAAIPDALAATLALEPDVESMAIEQADADRLLVLARGYEYATAREWALKLKELARVFADPYSAADFEHGPARPARARRPGPRNGPARPDVHVAGGVAGAATGGSRGRPRDRVRRRRGAGAGPVAVPAAGRDPGVARPDRVDRRRAAPRALPDARSRPRPGGAAQPQQGDANALRRPDRPRSGIRAGR